MFVNKKLKDNIVAVVQDKLPYIQGVTEEAKIQLMKTIYDSIDEAMGETWEDMSLAERCGPGIWDTLAWIAKVADTEEKPELYVRALEIIQEGHPCKEVCRPHIQSNLQTLDPVSYSSCFEHLHAFHNLVNRQLSKEQFPLYEAISKYDLDCDSCIFDPVGKKVLGNSSQIQYPVRDTSSTLKNIVNKQEDRIYETIPFNIEKGRLPARNTIIGTKRSHSLKRENNQYAAQSKYSGNTWQNKYPSNNISFYSSPPYRRVRDPNRPEIYSQYRGPSNYQ